MADNTAVWKDPRPLGRAATIALWCELGLYIFSLVEGLAAPYLPTQVTEWQSLYAYAGVLIAVILFGGAIVVMMWVYRVCRNTQAAGVGANRSAWGALLWNLVPIASLWKPFETFAETWKVAANPHSWRNSDPPMLLRWWWGLWLGQGIIGYAVSLMYGGVGKGGFNTGQMVGEAINNAVTIAFILVFLRIVKQLTAMQVTSREQGVFD